jgi:hypothetical protein
MISIKSSTLICLAVDQVFDFVSRPENDFHWQYGTLETANLTDGISGMGTFFRSIGHLIGRRNLSTFEVIEYKKNSKYGFRSLSGPLHSQTSYTFEIVEGGTRLNVLTRAHAVNSFQVNERSLGKKIKNETRENLKKLKGILEAQVSSLEIASLAL